MSILLCPKISYVLFLILLKRSNIDIIFGETGMGKNNANIKFEIPLLAYQIDNNVF